MGNGNAQTDGRSTWSDYFRPREILSGLAVVLISGLVVWRATEGLKARDFRLAGARFTATDADKLIGRVAQVELHMLYVAEDLKELKGGQRAILEELASHHGAREDKGNH